MYHDILTGVLNGKGRRGTTRDSKIVKIINDNIISVKLVVPNTHDINIIFSVQRQGCSGGGAWLATDDWQEGDMIIMNNQ